MRTAFVTALVVVLCQASSSASKAALKRVVQLHAQGTKLYQTKDFIGARRKFEQCIQEGATGELLQLSHYNAGVLARRTGDPRGAIGHYLKVVALDPKYTAARTNLCNLYRDLRQYGDAHECFKIQATHHTMNDALAHALVGDTLFHHRQGAAAVRPQVLQHLMKAVALDPGMAEVWANIGKLHEDDGHLSKAMAAYQHGIRNTGAASSYFNMGVLLTKVDELDKAEESYLSATRLAPLSAGAYSNLGKLSADRKQYEKAEAHFATAATLDPASCTSHTNIAATIRSQGLARLPEAQLALERAIQADGQCQQAYGALGFVLNQQQMFNQALEPLHTALALDPTDDSSFASLHDARTWSAYWKESRIYNQRMANILAYEARGEPIRAPRSDSYEKTDESPTIDFHFEFISLKGHLEMATRRAEYYMRKAERQLAPVQGSKHRERINLVYMSSNFRNHGISHLLSSMFGYHTRKGWNITCFATGPDDGSEYRPRIKASVDHFAEVDELKPHEIANELRAAKVDILIDLNGLTRGHRPEALARQPAPIQVNTQEYPGTIGARYIQYMTSDYLTAPPAIMLEGYSEKAVYMPYTYFANSYRKHFKNLAPVTTEVVPEEFRDAVLVSSFNQFYKIDPPIFSSWMNALRRGNFAGGSRLAFWLINYNKRGMSHLSMEAAARGVQNSSYLFSETAHKPTHLARCGAVDFFVDTIKCNGLTTTTDTLWSGVPGITMPTLKMAARGGASIASAAGISSLIVRTHKEYEDNVISLM